MKKVVFVLLSVALIACGSKSKKQPAADTGIPLEKRLEEYMQLNKEMNVPKILDYTYPGLFQLASRNDMQKAMEGFFKSDEMNMTIDSISVTKIRPTFESGSGRYGLVDYSMLVNMDFTPGENEPDNPEQNEMIRQQMADEYGEENVKIDEKTGWLRVRMNSKMVAVKDELSKEWSFVSFRESDPLIKKLFSKEIIEKLSASQGAD